MRKENRCARSTCAFTVSTGRRRSSERRERVAVCRSKAVLSFFCYFQASYSFELFKFHDLNFYVSMTLKLAVTFEYIQNIPRLREVFDLT